MLHRVQKCVTSFELIDSSELISNASGCVILIASKWNARTSVFFEKDDRFFSALDVVPRAALLSARVFRSKEFNDRRKQECEVFSRGVTDNYEVRDLTR